MQNQPIRKRFFKLLGIALAALLWQGCGDSEQFVFTNSGQTPRPGAAPVAVDDAFPALGNATLNQAAPGVLANDTLNGGAITEFDATGSAGGTLQLNLDGSFTYTPAVGVIGAETFAYTIANPVGEATATVTLSSTGLGRFVDNQAAPGGDGSQASPFNTLAAAIAAAQPGDTIFVAFGDGTSTGLSGAINLPAGVDLIGEGAGLVAQSIVPVGSRPTITGPVNCGGDNTISGFNIDGSATYGILIKEVADVRVVDNVFGGNAEEHIVGDEASGTVEILSNVFEAAPTDTDIDYIYLENGDLNNTVTFNVNDNTFLNLTSVEHDDLVEFDISDGNNVSIQCKGNRSEGTSPGMFEYGFYLQSDYGAKVTVDISDNRLINHDGFAIGLYCDEDSTLGGSVVGNVVDGGTGIVLYVNDDTFTVDGNEISNAQYGLDLYLRGGKFLVQNNTVSNADSDGIYLAGGTDMVGSAVAIMNNVINDSGDDALYVSWLGAGPLCLTVTDNTVNDDMDININGTGAINLFQKDLLASINEFQNGASPQIDDEVNNTTEPCQVP
ncbi:MAG: right-handed parallel beta-helix repeat-containing protein [Vulcanimicrobiota bacterium]